MKAVTYVELDVPEFKGGNDQVVAGLLYDFTANNNLSWTGSGATLTASFDGSTVAATGVDAQLLSPAALAIVGSTSRYVRIDIERTVARAGGTWEGTLYYTTASHGFTAGFTKTFADITNVVGTRAVIFLDMWALTAGGTDWQTSTVTQLRLDFDNGVASGSVKVRSVTVGSLNQDRSAAFDGATRLTRGAAITGSTITSKFTFSSWIRPTGTGVQRILNDNAGASGNRIVLVNNFVEITGVNAGGVQVLRVTSLTALSLNVWNHVLISVDLTDPLKCWITINGVASLFTVTTYTNDTMDFTTSNWAIGSDLAGANPFTGSLADLWFDDGFYIDLSIPVNVGLFLSSRNGPVKVGQTGEIPMAGVLPSVYMSGNYLSWQLNKGRGGGFAVTAGALKPAISVSETWRWAIPTDYLDPTIDAIPSVKNVSLSPATVSLGEDLGQRASVTVSFADHRHVFDTELYSAGTFWAKWRGRYMTKLRNLPMRVILGVTGQTIAQMDIHNYIVDSVNGPTPDGTYTINAKDILKLADDDRSQAPRVSNGSLSAGITNVAVSATLTPVGIGNLEYAASGFLCIGGKEIVSFTRAADVLTIVRGQLGTTAIAANTGDRVQTVLRYSGNDVADIIRDLLITYVTGVTDSMIPLAEWQAETAAYLAVLYTATITEPTGVKKLLGELINQAALALWWDDQAKLIRLKVLRQIATDAKTFDDETVVQSSLSVSEQPDKRVSQIWTFYGQRDPTNQVDKVDNYRSALATVDLALESAYGSPAIVKIPARWIGTTNAADRLNGIQLSRFRDPPRKFNFQLFRDQAITVGQGYLLNWLENQDKFGVRQNAPIQITRLRIEPDYIYVEAEEMLASGVVTVTSTVFLTTTGSVLNFTVPATWNNANNSIETLGAGSGGACSNGNGCAGGAGGAYSKVVNQVLVPGASLQYRIGLGGVGQLLGGANASDGGDTWFNGATLAASMVGAKGATAGVALSLFGVGGPAASGVGSTKTSGGDGGTGATSPGDDGGGGGGGAGGPHGNGAKGGNDNFADGGAGGGAADGGSNGVSQTVSGNNFGTAGGNNRSGIGGGTDAHPSGTDGGGGRGGDVNQPGNPGGPGEQLWTQSIAPIISAGPGGGGGGGGNNGNGGDGGPYGGGGAGAGEDALRGGNGYQGICIITWKG